MSQWEDGLFRLFTEPRNLDELKKQVEVLRSTVVSLIQDVAVLKSMLSEKGLWDLVSYKRLRIDQMVGDHSGAGAAPWRHYSHFPYTLSEEDFLRHQFDATDEEVRDFQEKVEFISQLS